MYFMLDYIFDSSLAFKHSDIQIIDIHKHIITLMKLNMWNDFDLFTIREAFLCEIM